MNTVLLAENRFFCRLILLFWDIVKEVSIFLLLFSQSSTTNDINKLHCMDRGSS